MVGPDRQRVLLGDRGHRRHVHHHAANGSPTEAPSAGRCWVSSTSSTTTATSSPPARSARCGSAAATTSTTTTTRSKTAAAKDTRGYSTVGDVGYLDEEGYLYLTDRKAFMIISGGVNIYPQEAENVLISHPKVLDVGVIGVPDAEMGEAVKAVVQPVRWEDAGPELEAELIEYCRQHLAAYKCPRSVDFDPELPRLDTGKLYKKQLRARYWDQRVDRTEIST